MNNLIERAYRCSTSTSVHNIPPAVASIRAWEESRHDAYAFGGSEALKVLEDVYKNAIRTLINIIKEYFTIHRKEIV